MQEFTTTNDSPLFAYSVIKAEDRDKMAIGKHSGGIWLLLSADDLDNPNHPIAVVPANMSKFFWAELNIVKASFEAAAIDSSARRDFIAAIDAYVAKFV